MVRRLTAAKPPTSRSFSRKKTIVRYTPTAASQTLIMPFITFPHCVCCSWRSLSVCHCLVNADVARCSFEAVVLVTLSWPRYRSDGLEYLWDHQTPVSFIGHLSSCFISVYGLFPLSIPAGQRKKPEGWMPLFTIQTPYHIFPFF